MKSLTSALPQYLWQSSNLQWGNPTFKVTWPFDKVVTWYIQKTYICSSAIPMATKFGTLVPCSGGNPPSKSRDLLITWSRDKLKHLYLHFHNTYGHQTWQGGNLPLEDPTYLVRWSFDNVATWQIQETYICSSAIPMATKLGRVVACGGGTPTSKSRALLITWSRDKFKKLISALPQYLWPPNLVE